MQNSGLENGLKTDTKYMQLAVNTIPYNKTFTGNLAYVTKKGVITKKIKTTTFSEAGINMENIRELIKNKPYDIFIVEESKDTYRISPARFIGNDNERFISKNNLSYTEQIIQRIMKKLDIRISFKEDITKNVTDYDKVESFLLACSKKNN